MELSVDVQNAPIREIDIIIGGLYVGRELRNVLKKIMLKQPMSPMISYIVNNTPHRTKSAPSITFTQEDVVGVHYPHCDALVVRAIVAKNGLKRMLVDNESSVNNLFGATNDKMLIDYELTPMAFSIWFHR